MAEKPRVAIFYGGIPDSEDIKTLKSADSSPHIVVGTPGRIKAVRLLLQAVAYDVVVEAHFDVTARSLEILLIHLLVDAAAGSEKGPQACFCATLCVGRV